MNNNLNIRQLETSLKLIGKISDQADRLAQALHNLLEGGDPEEATALLREFGYIDENDEWIG